MTVSIVALGDPPGVRIDDTIDHRRMDLHTSEPTDPRSVDPGRLAAPVDAAVAITTDTITFPDVFTTYIRDVDGAVVGTVDHFSEASFPAGDYRVELSGPVKAYLRVSGPLTVSADALELTIDLADTQEVLVGARSYHERPAATVTTTTDPTDLLTAISALGSALKTTAPERSYPTLRGHPPTIELGDELHVPDELARPDTPLTIEVPATYRHAFVVAPLAYYLGAAVVPGETPRIVGPDVDHELVCEGSFELAVERVLKRAFFLDCVTRTAATDAVTFREATVLQDRTDFDAEALYDASDSDRLAAYLDVPYEEVADLLPRWKLTAHVSPEAENADILPFLVNDLAVVRTPEWHDPEPVVEAVEEKPLDEFFRGGGSEEPTTETEGPTFVQPEQTDSVEQAWVGDHVPIGASKATTRAFRNRLARPEHDGDVDVVVVCNDPEMLAEQAAAESVYGSREDLPFEVTFYEDLTTDRLRLVLESDIDFLHYIGHIEDDGVECADGLLDIRSLDTVGVDAFFLNACRSYTQGMALIDRGAVGGVVTLDDVHDGSALQLGKHMARLLNRGFPLRAALTVASGENAYGVQYIVVGDGNMDIAHPEGFTPDLVTVETCEDGVAVRIDTYPIANIGLGALYRPALGDNDDYFLVGSPLMKFRTDVSTLREFLALEVTPLRVDGSFYWSDEFEFET